MQWIVAPADVLLQSIMKSISISNDEIKRVMQFPNGAEGTSLRYSSEVEK